MLLSPNPTSILYDSIRDHEPYNLSRPFLGSQYYILDLSDLCSGIERNIFKEIQFYAFYRKIISSWDGGNDLLYPTNATYHIWPNSTWEEDANGRRTTRNERCTTTDAIPYK